jgi:hypothetical protein
MLNRFKKWFRDRIRIRFLGPTLLRDIPLILLGSVLEDSTIGPLSVPI